MESFAGGLLRIFYQAGKTQRNASTIRTLASLNDEKTKIFFKRYNQSDLEIGNLGLLDISKAKIIMLDRKGEEIRREWNVEWFDKDRIAVNAVGDDESRYLYLYEFKY
jgi:hypothetical protein